MNIKFNKTIGSFVANTDYIVPETAAQKFIKLGLAIKSDPVNKDQKARIITKDTQVRK
jgi:hypothetical protein